MEFLSDDPEKYFATAQQLLSAEGMFEAADILRNSEFKIEETGYDGWNGGTKIWTIYLLIDPSRYARIGNKLETLEGQINNRLKPILEQFSTDWFSVAIVPKVIPRPDWRNENGDVSKETRLNIIDGLKLSDTKWSGRLEEVEFLQRIYNLEEMPSNDSRFKDASRDIWQHRVNNPTDWPDDWIYDDTRFGLLTGPTDTFLRFICEIVHPVVRPDRNEALNLVKFFNSQLEAEGWKIVEDEKLVGRSRFVPKLLNNTNKNSISRAHNVADALDAGWMKKEIERLENSIEKDPALAIGTAKELVESCCKTILKKRGIEFSRNTDLPELTKLLTKELKLVPEDIPDAAKGAETIRLILRNLATLTKYLSELRGLYGSGHGRDGKHKGLESRHARLAVGAAVTFIDFVSTTYQQREENS